MKNFLLALAMSIALFAFGDTETVTNVRGVQREDSKLVDIDYDLNATDYGTYTVGVEIEGRTIVVTATTFTGDVGEGVTRGTNRHIIWDAGADWPNKKGDVKVVVTVTKEDPDVSHGKVQLWEGGPYWADRNIGADNPLGRGLYFWWGDTTGHSPSGTSFSFNFYLDNSVIYTYGKSVSELKSAGWVTSGGVLAPSHDAAHVKWGGSWRMPTYQELYDLCYNKCDWTWTTTNGVNGYIVHGRGAFASRSIFLPWTGFGYGTTLHRAGSYGSYWSSVPDSGNNSAGELYFDSGFHRTISSDGDGRFDGRAVRPVQGFTSVGSSDWFFVDTTDGELTLAPESANWSSGSITLCCTNGNTSGTAHQNLQYYDTAKGQWSEIDRDDLEIPPPVEETDENGVRLLVAKITDKKFSKRNNGIGILRYRVTEGDERKAECETRTRYLLSVGYSAYGNKNKPIMTSFGNARDFRQECIRQGDFDASNTEFIYDGNARLNDIRTAIEGFSERVQSGDIFVFYIDTHGGDYDFKIVSNESAQQSEVEVVAASLVTYNDDYTSDALLTDMRLFPAGVAVIGIINACNAQSLLGGVDPDLYEVNNWLDHFGLSQCLGNVAWIAACGSGQSAYFSPFDTFGQAFIYDGLKNGYADMPLSGTEYKGGNSDTAVTCGELAFYAKEFSQGRSDSEPSVVQIENESLLNRIVMGRRQGNAISRPTTPENVVASQGRYEGKVYVWWSGVRNATSYRVYRAISGHGSQKEWIGLAVSQNISDDHCELNQHYEYQVQAVGPGGKSELSLSNEKSTGWSGTSQHLDFLDYYRPSTASTESYETLERTIAPNGVTYGASYVAGLDPTDTMSQFKAQITMVNDMPLVTWSPDLGASRKYTIYGKVELSDSEWLTPTNSTHRFFKVAVDMPEEDVDDGGNINMDDFVIEQGVLQRYVGDASDVVIPSSVTSLGNYAFAGGTNLVSVTIPGSVTNVGDRAFSYCSSLETIEFEGDAPSVGANAFQGVSGCTVYVTSGSTGWGVTIPGTWNGMRIEYADDGSGNSAPANDARANAETLTGVSGTRSFSTVDATVENGEPIVLSCESASTSVWFKWTAPIRGRATFSTAGSDFDTVLGVYRYDTLAEVAFNDDADDSTSRCTFMVQEGQAYYVVIAGYNDSGAAALSWEYVVGPANDDRANAETLTGASGSRSFSTVDATVEDDEPIVLSCESASASVWFKWTAPIRGRATFSTAGSDFDTVLGAYRYDTLAEVAFNDDSDDRTSSCSFLVQAGQTYYVVVAGYDGSGAAALSWDCDEGGTPVFTIDDGVLTAVELNGAFEVTIPGTVREIGESAFDGCEDLMSVVMSNGVAKIDDYAFYCCSSLESVTLPHGLKNIGKYAFANCYELAAVTVPEGVTNVGYRAFYSCDGLTSVALPRSLASIGEEAFAFCGGIGAFTVSDDNPAYKVQDGMLLTKNGGVLLHGAEGDVSIPSGVTRIVNGAFASCVGLTNVTIPTSVTNIGDYAFYGCGGLTNVDIPNSVQYIGKGAFQYCRGLADEDGFVIVRNVLYGSYVNQSEVEVPQGVVKIEDNVFAYRSDLTKVTIPSSVSGIGSYLFYNSSNLTNVTFEGNAPTVNNYSFVGVGSSCTVYVSRGSSGWGVAIPGTWNGMAIRFKDDDE